LLRAEQFCRIFPSTCLPEGRSGLDLSVELFIWLFVNSVIWEICGNLFNPLNLWRKNPIPSLSLRGTRQSHHNYFLFFLGTDCKFALSVVGHIRAVGSGIEMVHIRAIWYCNSKYKRTIRSKKIEDKKNPLCFHKTD
jgi:hypothetical protein